MRRIAFINEKGGSCKTTLAVNTAAYFAGHLGSKVLLVDMDPQGQSGKALGLAVRDLDPSMHDMLTDPDTPASACIHPSGVEGLDVLVANKRLADFPVEVANDADRETKLVDKLAGLTDYDFIIFDSPPSLGLFTVNIMLAADEIVVPVNLTYFALDGCAEIVETIDTIQQRFGKQDLRITLVVPTLYRSTRLADEILAKLKRYFPSRVARTVIGYNVKIDEAQSHGQTIFEYSSWSRGAHMLESLAKEIHRQG